VVLAPRPPREAQILPRLLQIPRLPAFSPRTESSASRGMNHHILMMEYRRQYRILERDDLALLYFTTDPLVPPHFFRRTPQGWAVELWTEANDTRNYVGVLVHLGDARHRR
jgi:hypothetical protein